MLLILACNVRKPLNVSVVKQCILYTHIVETNNCQIKWPGRCSGGGDAVAQEIQLRDSEHVLLPVQGQAAGGEDGEQCAEVRPVLLSGLSEDPVII